MWTGKSGALTSQSEQYEIQQFAFLKAAKYSM
jgi:hypothetical protein